MRHLINICLTIVFSCSILNAQTRSELEEQRKIALEEITYVDGLIKNTAKKKTESVNALKILGSKLNMRELIIKGMGEEINLLNERIEINRIAIDMMEYDLIKLKNDYSRTIVNSYKSKKVNPEIVYILSAKDFNQGYKRLKYLQQVSKFRRNESEIIAELKSEIEGTRERLENDLLRISDLQHREVIQKNLLQGEQLRKQRMLKSIGSKEKQLQRELAEKKKTAIRIEREIAKMIEEEKKKSLKNELTPEQKLVGDNFYDNKGKLPWPVERGIITSHYGIQQHPVLKYVTEENFGIEITSSGNTRVRSIFKGEVTAISPISGANMTIIIRHGKYLSVYNNLVNVRVKTGDKVETKQEIGEVFEDPDTNENCTLKFMIFEQKYLDPEAWIAKN
jgi:septal ring factor EnvC (AmiA/AmiB activator)